MAPLPAVPGVIRFAVQGLDDGADWVNVLHWRYTGTAPTGPNLTALSSTLLTAWSTHIGPLMSTGCSIETVKATDLASPTGAQTTFAATEPGTRAGAPLPASTAMLISKTVALRYRGGHPRSYLCVGVQPDLDSSRQWTPGFATAAEGSYSAMAAAVTGQVAGGTTLGGECVVSYVDKAVNPVSPFRRAVPLVLDVLTIIARTALATQRKRLLP